MLFILRMMVGDYYRLKTDSSQQAFTLDKLTFKKYKVPSINLASVIKPQIVTVPHYPKTGSKPIGKSTQQMF